MRRRMSNLFFIADFFVEDIPGGGERNNEELIKILRSSEKNIQKIRSHELTLNQLKKKDNENSFYIIANFINLKEECKNYFQGTGRYLIYEHDHKYIRSRNPADYENYKAPKQEIINYDFYEKAVKILCQSAFHSNIIKKNLNLDNVVSLGGNLWSLESLAMMRDLAKKEKENKCSIMNSNIPHKNTAGAILYCDKKSLEYSLIQPSSYYDFLTRLSTNKKLVFFPETPETLSRIVVEARMMNMSVITNSLVGATSEEWFSLKGEQLIDKMTLKREEIRDTILDIINMKVKYV